MVIVFSVMMIGGMLRCYIRSLFVSFIIVLRLMVMVRIMGIGRLGMSVLSMVIIMFVKVRLVVMERLMYWVRIIIIWLRVRMISGVVLLKILVRFVGVINVGNCEVMVLIKIRMVVVRIVLCDLKVVGIMCGFLRCW